MARIIITLMDHEYEEIINMALEELRTPNNQAYFLLRKALESQSIIDKFNIEGRKKTKVKKMINKYRSKNCKKLKEAKNEQK